MRGERDVQEWIAGLLEHGIAHVDLPMLIRVRRAWAERDARAVRRWSRELVARRETSELRLEDLGMGSALAQLLASFGVELPERALPFASAFAIASVEWSIPLEDACAGYAWAWCEAQVAAAVKLVPLGHTAGQRVLLALGERIPAGRRRGPRMRRRRHRLRPAGLRDRERAARDPIHPSVSFLGDPNI